MTEKINGRVGGRAKKSDESRVCVRFDLGKKTNGMKSRLSAASL